MGDSAYLQNGRPNGFPIFFSAAGKKAKKEIPVYMSGEIESIDPEFFDKASEISRKVIEDQNSRWEYAVKNPAHMFDHDARSFVNGVVVSLGRNGFSRNSVETAKRVSYALLLHDCRKGSYDEEGRDVHGKKAAEFADKILSGYAIEDEIRDGIISLVSRHESFKLESGMWKRLLMRTGILRKDEELFATADVLDRIYRDRIFIAAYNAIRKRRERNKGYGIEDFMKEKWFFGHGPEDDIFIDKEGDKRSELLTVFDDDVRETIRIYKNMEELGEDVLGKEVDECVNRILSENMNYDPEGFDMKGFYDSMVSDHFLRYPLFVRGRDRKQP